MNKPVDLKILQLNVKMLSALIFNIKQNKRALLIPNGIKHSFRDADIVCINELFEDDAEKIFDKTMKKHGWIHISKKVGDIDEVKKLGQNLINLGKCELDVLLGARKKCKNILNQADDGGVKIYSKHKIISQKLIIFKRRESSDAFAQKGAVRITIMKNRQKINIIATHLQSGFKKPKVLSAKLAQFKQIRKELIDEISDNEPIFIVGDFNLSPIEQPILFKGVLKDLKSKRLNGPFRGTTSTNFDDGIGKDNNENRMLDHVIFVENKVRIKGTYAIKTLKTKAYRLPNNQQQIRIGKIPLVGDFIGETKEIIASIEKFGKDFIEFFY